MNQFKILHPKEGVTIAAVKVPGVNLHFQVYRKYLVMGTSLLDVQGKIKKIKSGDTRGFLVLPLDDWQILGFHDQLSEEQCEELMPKGQKRYKDFIGGYLFKNATCAFLSLLEAHDIYSKNPFPKPADDDYSFYTDRNVSLQEEWHQAEANTGSWLILKKMD